MIHAEITEMDRIDGLSTLHSSLCRQIYFCRFVALPIGGVDGPDCCVEPIMAAARSSLTMRGLTGSHILHAALQ